MRRPDLRIRVQLTVSVCLFTLVCLVSLAVAIYTLSRSTLLGLEKGNLDLNSRMLREECRQEFEDMYNSFFRLSYSSPVQRIYENHTDSRSLSDAANLLHDSFGPDRIVLMTLYMSNGTEIMEVDSSTLTNRTNIPDSLLPLHTSQNLSGVMTEIQEQTGLFIGPVKAAKPVGDTPYLLSLTLPILNQTMPVRGASKNTSDYMIGYATFLITCLKIQHILSSVAISAASNEVSAAALCSANTDLTQFHQLIPFYDQSVESQLTSSSYNRRSASNIKAAQYKHIDQFFGESRARAKFDFDSDVSIPEKMRYSLLHNLQPTAQVNKGPQKSMVSSSQFGILNTEYYIVILQSRKSVFAMPHHLRNAIVISSCAIGGGMIIFTFLFVSFGARQILRLKMAATYEQQAPSKWIFLPLPWWLRPANKKPDSGGSDKSDFRVPEEVPLRKHVRDELDDITERFNIMSNELRKQYSLLEDRVKVRKEEIEQAKEAADIANAAKSHFLARVTHELRTPLNGIIGTATLCLEEDNIDNIHQSLRTIFKCGELLLHLMTDLLSFSQSEVENLDLDMRDFSLKEITSQLTAIFTEQCANKKINLVVDSNPEDDKYIFTGDTNRILQVIFNLMSNGIKFTPEGGEVYFNVEVNSLDHDPFNKLLTFYVRDNGPGIVPEMQARVFEAFVQGDISSHAKKAGVGLGLSICRQLADRMDGSIRLESEVGKGSTFIFKVPLRFKIADAESSGGTYADSLDVSSAASIFRNSNTAFGSPLGSTTDHHKTLEKVDDNALESAEDYFSDTSDDKPDAAKSSRSVLARTLLSTSQRTKVLLSSRRKTQSSIFAPREFLKRRFSADTVLSTSESGESLPREPSSPKSLRSSSRVSSQNSMSGVPPPGGPGPVALTSQASISPRPNRKVSGGGTTTKHSSSSEDDDSNKPSTPPDKSPNNLLKPEVPKPDTQDIQGPSKQLIGADEVKAKESTHQNNNADTTASTTATTTPNVSPSQSRSANDSKQSLARPPIAQGKSYYEHPPSNIRVLVVDDNLVNQEVMMRMLNLEGLKSIKVANDGIDALEKIRQADAENESFDVIFMDVQMPNMDGRQATRIIRNEMHKTVPVVAVSAFANEKNADDCIEAGMNLFLSKPLRRPHLREILRSLASFANTADRAAGNDSKGPSQVPLKTD